MPQDTLPPWERVLVVVAHPDDESFGLGGVIGAFAAAGAAVHVLCFSRGEASTLGADLGDLREIRSQEFAAAARVLGVSGVDLLDLPDGALAAHLPGLIDHVTRAIARLRPDGMLIFHRDGVTGHPDHVAAGSAALTAAEAAGLPVLEWTVPLEVAAEMSSRTGGAFTGVPPHEVDIMITVDRERHRRAIGVHVSQAVQGSPLWLRLDLLGEVEHLQLTTFTDKEPRHDSAP